MAFVAVDEDGEEWIFEEEPCRYIVMWVCADDSSMTIRLPKGSIRKLIGRELTWLDEPVEIKGE